ncbi:hypothetical protein COCHEDRAFT_1020726, partial [Bipolaris maydis C5]
MDFHTGTNFIELRVPRDTQKKSLAPTLWLDTHEIANGKTTSSKSSNDLLCASRRTYL